MYNNWVSGGCFLVVIILNVVIIIVEIIGGFLFGSFVLFFDVFYNFGDLFLIVLGYFV